MSTFRFGILLPTAALCLVSSVCRAQHPNLGRPLTPEEVSKLDITVTPEGGGLPEGSGSVSAGAKVYADKCQSCHGTRRAKADPRISSPVESVRSHLRSL